MTILENILNTVSSKKSFYIPAGTMVDGALSADVPGQIAGTVNGDVFVKGRLVVLKHAVINGNVNAKDLEISGSVTGNIHCNGKMILQNTCFVKGNINTFEIHIEKDAVVDGIITKPAVNKTGEEIPIAPATMHDLPLETLEETAEPLITMEEPVVNTIEEPVQKKPADEEVTAWF